MLLHQSSYITMKKQERTYKGKNRKTSETKVSEKGLTTTFYLTGKTVVQSVDRDGIIELTIEPP